MASTPAALVVATCAVAGSGKTTFARRLEAEGYVRLSVDQVVWQRFGAYGVDYPAQRYEELSAIARDVVRGRLVALVTGGVDVVLDLSLWRRGDREHYRALVEGAGGRWCLVHLAVPADELRARLAERAARRDADAAFEITAGRLACYLDGFQTPTGEGEVVLSPEQAATWWPPPRSTPNRPGS